MSSFQLFFFFKQKTAYEMRISDWSSDVCSSDLGRLEERLGRGVHVGRVGHISVTHSEGTLGRLDQTVDEVEAVRLPAAQTLEQAKDHEGDSEERRVGKECVSTCRSRWSPYH